MAFQLNKNKGPMAEINVTPLVDVMLVLLVIFMITAPLMYNGIQMQLPRTKKVHQLNLSQQQVILSVNKAEELFIGEEKVTKDNLIDKVKEQFKKNGTEVLFLRGDHQLKYEVIAKLMAHLKNSGIGNLALVTEVEKP